MSSPSVFYVYMLRRPWNGVPCYIGKGQRGRAYEHERMGENHYNRHLANVIKRAGGHLFVEILHTGLEEAEAFRLEVSLIKTIGRADKGLGPLCNWTDGGEGASGVIVSDETRSRMRASSSSRWGREEDHEAIAAWWDDMSPIEYEAHCKKISDGTRAGMKRSGASGKISRALAGKTHDEARRALTGAAVRAANQRDPTIGKRAAATRKERGHPPPMSGKTHSEESRARMKSSHLARNARLRIEAALQ